MNHDLLVALSLGSDTLVYAEHGTGDAALIVLAPVGRHWMLHTLPERLGQLFRMVIVEPRGTAGSTFGGSSSPTLATALEDIAAIETHLSLKQPYLLAHSANGLIAMAYAAQGPQVAGVIAVGTPPDPTFDRDRLQVYWDAHASDARKRVYRERLTAAEATERDSEEEARAYRYADAVRRWHRLDIDTRALDQLSDLNPAWVRAVLFESAAEQDWPALLASIECPLLVILGRSDFIAPPQLWAGTTLPPRATLTLMDESSHTPFVEEPDHFCTAIENWLHQPR